MDGPRRRFLAASGSLVSSLAGCLGEFSGGRAPVTAADADAETTATTRTATEPTRTTDAPDYPATVNVTTTVEREEIEYVEGNDTVQYVAAYRHSNHDEVENGSKPEREPVYETIPFDEWAETECAHVGAKRVHEAMDERLGGEVGGISAGVTTKDGEKVVVVARQTLFDRDGDVISEPTVSYDRVKRAAPERVEVTLSLSGRSRSCVVPVTTRERELHQT